MPSVPTEQPFGSREILRYVRVRQPRVVDLRQRAIQSPAVHALLEAQGDAAVASAREYLASKNALLRREDLRYSYFAHLSLDDLPSAALPTRAQLRDPATFSGALIRDDQAYRSDHERALQTVTALSILGRRDEAAAAARLLAFIEAFPALATIDSPVPYPHPILRRLAPQAPRKRRPAQRNVADGAAAPAAELTRLSASIGRLWRLRNTMIETRRAELHKALAALPVRAPVEADPPTREEARNAALRRTQQATALMQAYRDSIASSRLPDLARAAANELTRFTAATTKEVAQWQQDVLQLQSKYDIQAERFCVAYENAASRADVAGAAATTWAATAVPDYREHPDLRLDDRVRVMGHADLIKVTETFLRYSHGEVSYIENILPGELRRRRVKSTKYFEQLTETVTEQTYDSARESSVTAKVDLSSQIETELNAKLSSDINASASGSGGGSIGVVDFEGSASAAANVNVGLDSRSSTQDKSAFSQEIVNKAIEKTKSSTIERRLNRQTALYETLNSYEINNTGAEPRSGIYCFLDKHVCITETLYGKRLFLLATVHLPGRNLLNQRQHQLQVGLTELGQKPVFDIAVQDIQPSNYQALVSRFKAANVSPPPPATQNVARTYKTDTSNQNVEKQEFNPGKVADLLAPFFERYQRYLVTDTIRLPDGYEVFDVTLTVNHGHNGISIPAHLPLKVAAATAASGLTMAAAGVAGYLGPVVIAPLAMWQFGYSVSPVLHYNTDSSNVAVCVGTQTLESSYFFFDPLWLMQAVFDALGSVLARSPQLLDDIQRRAVALVEAMKLQAAEVPAQVAAVIESTVFGLIDQLSSALNSFRIKGSIKNGFRAEIGGLLKNAVDASRLIEPMKDMFTPLQTLIDDVIALIREGVADALSDTFEYLSALTEPSETLSFTRVEGMRGELPVSINAVTINPGVTVNLVACLRRTDEALDKWRLDTFASLYQAHLQQLAEYDTRSTFAQAVNGLSKSPATMRREEHLALKELVLHALNNTHSNDGNVYSLEKINFFEHALDWNNMSFRLYNYGPNAAEVLLEKSGVFAGTDDRRRAFVIAPWCQAMLPVQPDDGMEERVRQFFRDGSVDLESGVDTDAEMDELTALYQDLVQERARIGQAPQVLSHREEVIPTDLIVIGKSLPENTGTACGQPVNPG